MHPIFSLLERLGDACVIAGLLGIVVDQAQKAKLIQEVVEAASPQLIGRHLPAPVHDALMGYFNISFVRPSLTAEYKLTCIRNVPDFLEVTSRVEGPVVNYSPTTQTYQFVGSIDPPQGPSGLPDPKIARVMMKPELGDPLFDEEPVDSLVKQRDGSRLYTKDIPIPPGILYKTILDAVEYRPTSYILPLFLGTTVANSVVRIDYPKDVLTVKVSTSLEENIKLEPDLWGGRWVIPTALLPGQCIMVTWMPVHKGTTIPPAPPVTKSAPPAPPSSPFIATAVGPSEDSAFGPQDLGASAKTSSESAPAEKKANSDSAPQNPTG